MGGPPTAAELPGGDGWLYFPMLETESLELLREALAALDNGFAGLPEFHSRADTERMRGVLMEAAERMKDNYPYHHPLYAGQMLKPPHPVARLAFTLSLWINPNNHALDGGRASSAMEKEAVAAMARVFGWSEHLGHLCGGGTMANLEALWIAGRLNPGKPAVASTQAHYTHARISDVLGIPFRSVPVDERGRMDPNGLEDLLRREEVGTVTATLGSTATGAIDPLADIVALRDRYGFRLHVDAAYGGYFVLADNLDSDGRRAFDALPHVDSIVVDPHKHGLQPYGCGCVLFRDPSVGSFYKHDSPYTYFSSDSLHLGEISLECSRPGAAAVALWSTLRLLPPVPGGEFARGLEDSRRAALELYRYLNDDPRYMTPFPPQLDIVVWGPKEKSASAVSDRSRELFRRAAAENLHLALADLPSDLLRPWWGDVEFDRPTVTCLRSCLMKPEHLQWMDEIRTVLQAIAAE